MKKHIVIFTDFRKENEVFGENKWYFWDWFLRSPEIKKLLKTLGVFNQKGLVNYKVYPECGMDTIDLPSLGHPRDQAEWMSKKIKTETDGFVVVTNSDYIKDRARIELRERGDFELFFVSYCEQDGKLYVLEFDKNANMYGGPKRYRDWFIEEQHKFLGFEEKE